MDNQEMKMKQSNRESQKSKQIQHHQQSPPQQPLSSSSAAAASPPSPSPSPSHEFSFTISLHPTNNCTKTPDNNKTKPSTPQSLLDLSPADEIFFHGHLLPLHLLSRIPVSPRSSTNSIDSSLPIKDLLQEKNTSQNSNIIDDTYYDLNHSFHHHETNICNTSNEKPKSKSFSLFSLPKWKKGEKENKEKQSKLKFDVSQVLKRYIRMVRPFLSFRSRKNMQFDSRQSYSFSGNLSFRRKNNNNNSNKGIRRGAYSAPVSMKNSPTNSGLLVATPPAGKNYSSSSSDSTMEELQAAIQAAIAHCKKSSSMEEKIKRQQNDLV